MSINCFSEVFSFIHVFLNYSMEQGPYLEADHIAANHEIPRSFFC